MTEGFRIKVDDENVRQAIRKLLTTSEDPKPFHHRAAFYLVNQIKTHFDRQADEAGVPWKPMSPLTRWLRRAGKGQTFAVNPQLLQDTGRLRNSITRNVDKSGFEAGTNLKYAALQQFGSDGPITPKKGKFLLIPIKGRRGRQKAVIGAAGEMGVAGFDVRRRKKSKKTGLEHTTRHGFIALRRATIPARPFVYADDAELNHILGIYTSGLEKAFES